MEGEINEFMYFSPSYNFFIQRWEGDSGTRWVAAVEAGGSQGDALHNTLITGGSLPLGPKQKSYSSFRREVPQHYRQKEHFCHFCIYIILWGKKQTLNVDEIHFYMPSLPLSSLFLCWALVAGSIHHPLFSQWSLLLPKFHLKVSENLSIWASW